MTGYGRGVAERHGRRVAVEIRGVNHRFLDVKFRGGPLDPAVEDKLLALLRGALSRGSVAVSLRAEGGATAGTFSVDVSAGRLVHAELRRLADAIGDATPIPLALLLAQPGVICAADETAAGVDLGPIALEAAERALGALLEMRRVEGAALKADILERLGRIDGLLGELEPLAAPAPAEAQRRLEERVARLLKSPKLTVDEGRLPFEIALLAERLDVTEEIVRARSHLQQFRELAGGGEPVGRRLDFLLQELGREFNTVTSKSQSAEIARLVVEVKAELEKIREQVQNIE